MVISKKKLTMSIPKEPRQLMINIMYLVLTAMLALNVSAEVLNAFLSMNRSLNESTEIMDQSNQQLMAAITEQAEAYSQFQPYAESGMEVQKIAKDFSKYVEGIKTELVEVSGGLDEDGLPVGIKNKDVTTRMLVTEGRGSELEKRINKVRTDLLAQITDLEIRQQLAATLPIKIEAIPENSDKENWAQFKFQQMPVAAVLPLLAKIQNDVEISETSILGYFYKKTGSTVLKPDQFLPIAATNSSYLTVGEKFSAELFLGAYSSTADNISIQVDGRNIPVHNGKAVFNSTAGSLGEQSHRMVVKLRDPVTGKVEKFEKTFGYTVGEKSVAVAADKMNVFYVGVDNPLSLSAAGVPSTEIRVQATGADLNKISNGKYIVKPARIGESKITVSGGGLEPTIFKYRVKKIPDPQIMIGQEKGGEMSAGEFSVHPGIRAHLENFDFEARCNIQGFELTRVPKGGDAQSEINRGGAYAGATKRLVNAARSGDTYYFEKIKVRCPGDVVGRKMNGMIFKIK